MKTVNLVYDNIKDFKPGQSIYMQITEERGHPRIFECEFIKFEKNMVYGKVVSATVNESLYTHRINSGWEVKAKFTSCALWGKLPNANRETTHWFDGSGYAAYETIEKMRELMPPEHNSYGAIRFSRGQSSKAVPLFGSSIKHSNIITMTVSRAKLNRDLNNDWIHSTDELIEVVMSESQFAQAITMFNRGEGVPVTIQHVNREPMDPCPYVSKLEQFSMEFEQDMKQLEADIQQTTRKAAELLGSGKALNKGERELILKAIESLTKTISSKMPFVADQFNEQMDKTVTEAKKEIETFMMKKAIELGINPDGMKPLEIE